MEIRQALQLLAMAGALAACAYANVNGHVQFYSGNERPDTDVALIKGETTPRAEGTARVRLIAINGRQLTSDAGANLPGAESASVLPGTYTLNVMFLPANPRLPPVSDNLTLNLHPACEYQVIASWNHQRHGFIFDVLPSQHGPVNPQTCAAGLWPAPPQS